MDIQEFAKKGGIARAQKLTQQERSASARKAALAMHASKKFAWGNILNDQCPKCASKLEKKETVIVCSSDTCLFTIRKAKHEILVAKLIKKPL